MHFRGRTHIIAMRKIASKQKSILAQMRQAQRNTQNELEKNSDELTDRTNYCPLCKLNYKQKRAVHQLSEAHQNMKKFLIPQCKICNIIFKSPMGYEIHCCSIKHIKVILAILLTSYYLLLTKTNFHSQIFLLIASTKSGKCR